MLLSTGERVAVALMSMALNEMGCPAISFTGSQAGILTDNTHNNARIRDIKPIRLLEELQKEKVVVLAGFQGVDPISKDVTTLGRGGTDTTAVALAHFFQAESCQMLKDVDGIFTADPKLVPSAKQMYALTYDQLLDMTYWGAKVLHFRAVELAKHLSVPLYIGLAHGKGIGTLVKEENTMYEQSRILSINSHQNVVKMFIGEKNLGACLSYFHQFLKIHKLAWPQILDTAQEKKGWSFYLTGPMESLQAIMNLSEQDDLVTFDLTMYATVSATCEGNVGSDITEKFCVKLDEKGLAPVKVLTGPLSITGVFNSSQREKAIQGLHELI
jgi:aspartate kinase